MNLFLINRRNKKAIDIYNEKYSYFSQQPRINNYKLCAEIYANIPNKYHVHCCGKLFKDLNIEYITFASMDEAFEYFAEKLKTIDGILINKDQLNFI